MRTRKTDLSKSTPVKRTPPARKASAAKSTPSPSTATPQASETKPGVATRSRQPKNTVSDPAVVEAKDSSDIEEVTPEAASGRRYATRRASARKKTPTSAKAVSKRTPNSKDIVVENVKESSNNEGVKDADVVELIKEEELSLETVVESKREKKERPVITVGVSMVEDGSAIEVADLRVTDDEVSLKEETVVAIVEETPLSNVPDSVREDRNLIEMAEVPDIDGEQLPMTNIGESEKSSIQDKEFPHVNAWAFENLDEAVDKKVMKSLEIEKSNSTEEQRVEAQEGSVGHGEVKITDVSEGRIEPSNMEEDFDQGEDQVEEVQKDLELGGNKIIEHTEGTKIQPSNVDKKPNETQIQGAQEELNEDRESRIMEVSEESKINLSNMEEDPNEAQVEGAQRELKDEEQNIIMENPEESKINPSNMEEDLTEAQVEGTKGELKNDEKNEIIENSEESKINPSMMDEDPNEAQVEGTQGELKDDEKIKIIEYSEESKISPSTMEEDPNEALVEGAQGEMKDEKNKIMDNSEVSKIFPSNMEGDTNKDKDQVKRRADLENKRSDLTDVSNIEPSSMEKDPNEVQVVGAQGELKDDKKKKIMEVPEESNIEPSTMKADFYEKKIGEDMNLEVNKKQGEELLIEAGNQEGSKKPEEDKNAGEPSEESKTLEQEQIELTAITLERKIEREHEIFVGGLDNDALEDDVRKAFENIGEIVEVQLHKSSSTHQNKGYAFVKFANKEHAKRALSEMKNPVIHGKRCSTAPREDNNTLFVGNICNTWTKEAIKRKLKEYELEGVENITLVPDAQHDGLSRGFAFLEFSCHGDAMLAYKRLQKPDAIFGHHQRTVKVAFAEPLKVPSTDIMALVKSVFIDGLPPYWNEDRVRNHFKGYGEIERIMLARNMSTAKRKDFGFVDFTTHEAALACIESVNNTELGDGNSKMKVRARLSNPSPKIQAVKGGLYGGFRFGHGGSGSFSKPGKGIGRGGHALNHANFQQGRDSYQHGRNHTGRIGFTGEYDVDNSYPAWQNFERGGRGVPRGSHQVPSRGASAAGPSQPFLDRSGHNSYDIGRGEHFLPRRPGFLPEGGFDRPFNGSHLADPYLYDDGMHGIKRPFDMTQDPGYMGPSRVRPRFDYPGPPRSFPEAHYHDHLGGRRGVYPHDHYGPNNYGGAAYSSFHSGNRPGGHGYGGDRPPGGNYGDGRPYRGGHN